MTFISKRSVAFVMGMMIICFCLSSNAAANSTRDVYDVIHRDFPSASGEIYVSRHNGVRDNLHLRGARENVLVIGPSARPDDLTLVVWFHGLNGFSKKTFRRVLRQVAEVDAEGNSIAVLIPEMPWSTNTRTPRKRQGKVWRQKKQFKNYLDEAQEKLDVWAQRTHGVEIKSISVTVIGHSAGGSAIMSASREGSLCDDRVDRVIWSDASYGPWLKNANRGCLKDADVIQTIVVRKWDKPHQQAKTFFRSNPGLSDGQLMVLDRKRYTHTRIGNEVINIVELFPTGC